ncbi:phosphotransferase [Oryctes borbonicus]|uniref:Phosphotransferase n=1 Tax=Oryctes borbonicus TaxID=1629725 RepID=A0A0T6BHU0_9SCAR|nr:phosphotransferase [Oryctes borbonicus]
MDNSNGLFNKEDCCIILKNHIKDEAAVYKSHEVRGISTVEGLIGKHYKLKIVYEAGENQRELDLFLKELNTANKVMQYLIDSIKAYDKEAFYYSYLLPEFNSHNIHINFAPICCYCRPSLAVFEDLSLRGFRNSPKRDMLDIKHCKVALATLAKFHAATVSYEKAKSKADENVVSLLQQFPQILDDTIFGDTQNAATEWLECTFRGLLDLIDLLPEDRISAEEYKVKVADMMELQDSNQFSKYKSTILHGDLWSNNFMFEYKNDIPVNSILIDYQIIKYGPIALDVVQMIITNVRRSIRDVHYEELLSYYYHQFVDACEKNNFRAHDFISYKDFMACSQEVEVLAKMQCAADHSVTFLSDKTYQEAIATEESLRNFLFESRSKGILESYNEDTVYREIMVEDMIELRDLLFNT